MRNNIPLFDVSQRSPACPSEKCVMPEIQENLKNSVPTSQYTHGISITKSTRLMLYREVIAHCCKNHMRHKYRMWAKCSVLKC
jgi:hypothetical protein